MIVVVEDSDEDFEATARALQKAGSPRPLVRCRNSREALDCLHARGRFAHARPADLVLLDLNLPGTDGRAVLKAIKADPATAAVPVVVLTTSTSPDDVAACYRDGASSYVVKSVDYRQFVATVATLVAYWFGAVRLPPGRT
ncbi:response regulator [Gemmata sp. JC717]|uniref:Response regulator n=1 Tax=Gemmata algarum TaxID=2975278 RepID=A0ABU5F9X0_9BACT|nr:response regulator [Gemmata algarum]MDY3555642.1 response regulator [Gemmata algarum]MDY3562634.1 response regulator [Gemmata algarum]